MRQNHSLRKKRTQRNPPNWVLFGIPFLFSFSVVSALGGFTVTVHGSWLTVFVVHSTCRKVLGCL
uniref:Transmembrane protein n=1 Tax=candidate division WOR-3 bacterium TaxID=2052148 RepID=A0A7C6EAP7_UNCW3